MNRPLHLPVYKRVFTSIDGKETNKQMTTSTGLKHRGPQESPRKKRDVSHHLQVDRTHGLCAPPKSDLVSFVT